MNSESSVPTSCHPFFVVGTDRSGSTMLRLMLSQHPRLHIPNESWFLIDLMRALPLTGSLSQADVSRAIEIIVGHRRWRDWGIPDERLMDQLNSIVNPCLSTLIDGIFRLAMNGTGKQRWGDKTPEYVIHIESLHSVFRKAQFIHVIRDARDVSQSLTRNRWRGDFLYRNAYYWKEYVGKGTRAGHRLGSSLYLEVAYEDLVEDPRKELARICAFLGEEFSEGMVKFYEHADQYVLQDERSIHVKTRRPPRASDCYRWKREMRTFEIAEVESIAFGTMRKVQQRRVFPLLLLVPIAAAFFVYRTVSNSSLPLRKRVGLMRASKSEKLG